MGQRHLSLCVSAVAAGQNARDLRPNRDASAHLKRLFSLGKIELSTEQSLALLETPLRELVASF